MLLSWFLSNLFSGGISPVAPPVETGGAIIINNHKKKCFLRMDLESVE